MSMRCWTFGLAMIAALTLRATFAAAQADPPGRVGRLDAVQGTVWTETADGTSWEPTQLNYPVSTGTNLWAAGGARAEIEVGPLAVRLDQNTVIGFQRLDDGATQIRLSQGSLNVAATALDAGAVQVMTPSGEIDLVVAGRYHVDAGAADGSAPGQLTVFAGSAQIASTSGPVTVGQGQSATLSGNPPNVAVAAGAPEAAIDQWADSRDAAMAPPQYVPPGVTGYEDLATNGTWQNDPQYGQVWYPSDVAADWQPYRYGHWAYVAPWGWTWIDDAPWGFAPFHYGRWAQVGARWAWVPGAYVGPPVYAPALVAFVGGNGFTIGVGAAAIGVGWVPLAPFEVFVPTYRASPAYMTRVNREAVRPSQLAGIAARRDQPVAIAGLANREHATVVPRDAFVGGRPVAGAAVQVPAARLAAAHAAVSAATVAPAPAPRASAAGPATGPRPATRPAEPARPFTPIRPTGVPGGTPQAAPGAVTRAPAPEPRPQTAPAPSFRPAPQVESHPSAPAANRPAAPPPAPRPPAEARPPQPAQAPRVEPPRAEPPRVAPPEAAAPRVEPPRVEAPRPAAPAARPEPPPAGRPAPGEPARNPNQPTGN